LWTHESRPISFTLVVDDFGVKYVTQDDIDHLITSLKSTYKLTEDWTGNLYCGITLEWDYVNRTVDISMPGYIKKKLQEYEHVMPKKLQTCPYSPEPKHFGFRGTGTAPPRFLPDPRQEGDQAGTTNRGKYSILRTGSGYDCFDGSEFDRYGPNKSDGENDE
jgi:hypothetical protein